MLLFAWLDAHPSLSADWPQWRGPNRNGVADEDATPPLVWSESQNVKWKIPVRGRGLSSPVVVGDRVLLTTATETEQVLVAVAREDGGTLWETRVHEGGLPEKLHRRNSAATPTVASDGERFYVVFHNRSRVMLSAVDWVGNLLWQREAGRYECDYGYGYAPSPSVYQGKVIVSGESLENGFLAAFSTQDGAEVWRQDRKIKTSYSSPIVARVNGRDQVLLSGGIKVSSYDPADGKLIWQRDGATLATSGTMVWDENRVFASGGFPNKETIALRLSAQGTQATELWKSPTQCYEQSVLYYDDHLYAYDDAGILVCWDAETGEVKWRERLGGPVSASPIAAGGRIYAMNERGITHVIAPNPAAFTKLAENTLGQEGFATPAFVGGEVFIRTATLRGERQEYLYCLSEE